MMNLILNEDKPWSHWIEELAGPWDLWQDSPLTPREKEFSPVCDFQETEDHYFFSLDLPGVKKDNISIELSDNTLHISGEKKNEYRDTKIKGQQFFEKFYGRFKRSFQLPTAVKKEGISAHFQDGVLELILPKRANSAGYKVPIGNSGKKGSLFSKLGKEKTQ